MPNAQLVLILEIIRLFEPNQNVWCDKTSLSQPKFSIYGAYWEFFWITPINSFVRPANHCAMRKADLGTPILRWHIVLSPKRKCLRSEISF